MTTNRAPSAALSPDDWPPPEPYDELPFGEPTEPPSFTGAEGRKCRRHVWAVTVGYDHQEPYAKCVRCGALRDAVRSRRGKNNRSRGNAIERAVAAQLGLRRVGQFGGPDDVSGAMFAGQVKSGAVFSEKLWRWLKAVPVNADQTAILVITDAPGPGHRRRAVVVVDLDDWKSLHGPEVDAA